MNLGKRIIIHQDVATDTATADIPLPQRTEYIKEMLGGFMAGFTGRIMDKHGSTGHIQITIEYVPDSEVKQ